MTIKIYNTLTRKKEVFNPIEPGKVKMYVCGPTVYNYIHIGNARPAIVFDTVRRYLKYAGYDVTYLLNFTDIDDKIIKAAQEADETVEAVTSRYIKAYHEDVAALGVKPATLHPKVTESIDEIIQLVEDLIEKGHAYEANGDVYYKTRSFDDYGKLSDQSLDDLRAGSRIEVDDKKQDALDFTLWKAVKPGEVSWGSPWSEGRPGWHIECSAMTKKHLGDTIDIHAGGQDLIFPHHENEIAQSEAHTGKSFANYWIHNGYVSIDDEKMSKSLGNYILARDLIDQYPPALLRFFILSVHYRHPINFSDSLIKQTKKGFDRITNVYRNLQHQLEVSKQSNLAEPSDQKLLTQIKNNFIQAMNDDFNTANAISAIFELTKEANLLLKETETDQQMIADFLALFDQFFEILGLDIPGPEEELLAEDIDQLLIDRENARKNKDYERADQIRDQLKNQNIILEDTAQGIRWKRG